MPDGRVLQDADGVVLGVEAPGDSLFGWSVAELVGTRAPMLVHPDDREIAQKVRNQVRTVGQEQGVQIRLRTRSARWLWADCWFKPSRDGSGNFGEQTVLELRDASSQFLQSEALSLLVELRNLIDAAPTFEQALEIGLARLASWGRFAAARAWEPDADSWSLVGDDILAPRDGMAGNDVAARQEAVRSTAGSQAWAWVAMEHADGIDPADTVRAPSRSLFIPLLSNGSTIAVVELCGGTASVDDEATELVIDVAGQLGDAFLQRRIERELLLARRRFELAFNEASIGMALVAPDGTFLDANESLCNLLGRSRSELAEIGFQAVTYPADLEGDLEFVGQVLNGERTTYQTEKRYLRADGSVIWGLLSVSLVRDEVGQPVHFISQIQNIDDRKRAEADSARSVARFRAAFDDSPIGMALIRVDGERAGDIIESNGRLLSLAADLGRPLPIANLEHVLGTENCLPFDELNDPERGGASVSREGRLDGVNDERWVRLIAAPVSGVPDDVGRYAVVQVEDITEQRLTQDRLAHTALHDALTGLPNRTLISDRLGAAQKRSAQSGCHIGLMLIDLDDFKDVNDSLGHQAGDRLLEEVARRFANCLRPTDTAARLGGDEFVILCDGLSADPDRARQEVSVIARRVHDSLSVPVDLDGTAQWVTASIGTHVAVGNGDSIDVALCDADAALYQAKLLGRSQTASFDDELRRKTHDRSRIARELGRALPEGQLHVAYQPVIALTSRRTIGLEALLRWEHPTLGNVPPDQFIPVAERSNTIVQLGEYVTERVCETLAHRPELGQVAMNVSASQLARSNFVDTVMSALDRHKTPARRLSIELTENMLIGAADSSLRQLHELKELGVAIGVDDFGTGYASLTYLKSLPITFVKIDRSFVAGIVEDTDDRVIVNAVVGLANDLGLATVAEGVEQPEQADLLEEMGCTYAQGYYFGRPKPLAEHVHSAARPPERSRLLVQGH